MITFGIGIVCVLVGWIIGWAHAIYFGNANEAAMIDECCKLDLEVEALKKALAIAQERPAAAVLQGGAEAGAVL